MMSSDFFGSDFRVGSFTVMPVSRIIRDEAGRESTVDPKPMAVLIELMRSAGRPVSRATLFDAVWGDTIVVEEALTRCISELRRVLGDSSESQQVIRTIRGSGYMLLLPVAEIGSAPGAQPSQASTAEVHGQIHRSSRARVLAWAASVVVILGIIGTFRTLRPADPGPPSFRPVTFQEGMERSPSLSASGAWLAFIEVEEGGKGRLGVTDLEAGSQLDLTWLHDDLESSIGKAVWVSDGIELLMMTGDVEDCSLVRVHLSLRTHRDVGSCRGSYHRDLDISPDGDRVVYSRLTDGGLPMELVELDLHTGLQSVLLEPSGAMYGDHHPVFAPDGSRVAFVRSETESDADVFVLDLRNRDVDRVTAIHAVFAGLAWRGSSTIVFSSSAYGPLTLWEAPTGSATASPTWLATGTDDAAFPTVARETGRLAFARNRTVTDLVSWRAGKEDILLSDGAINGSPSLSPDGTRLAYVSDATGYREVWLMDVASGQRRQLTNDKAWTDSPVWSPDGSSIAYTQTAAGYHALWIHSLVEGGSRKLSPGPADTILPTWLPDGSGLVASTQEHGAWHLWTFPVDGRPGFRTVEPNFAVRAQETLTQRGRARLLVFHSGDGPGLRVHDPESRMGWSIAPELQEVDWGGWTVVGDSLFYLVRSVSGISLRSSRLQPAGSRSREVAILDAERAWSIPWHEPALAVRAAGDVFIFPRVSQRSGEIWAAMEATEPSQRLGVENSVPALTVYARRGYPQ